MSLLVCRDRGRLMWKGGGLVPVLVWVRFIGLTQARTNRVVTRDRHKAPTSTPPFPLSLQGAERSSFPDSVVSHVSVVSVVAMVIAFSMLEVRQAFHFV